MMPGFVYTNQNLILRCKLNWRSVLPQFISASLYLEWRGQTYLARPAHEVASLTNVGNRLEEKRVNSYRKIGFLGLSLVDKLHTLGIDKPACGRNTDGQ